MYVLQIPAIVYFEKQIPNIYDGDLMDEEEILHWLVSQLEHDEIEDVTDEMLDKMVKEGRVLAVLFCNYKMLLPFRWQPHFLFVHPEVVNQFFISLFFICRWQQRRKIRKGFGRIGKYWRRMWSIGHYIRQDGQSRGSLRIWHWYSS